MATSARLTTAAIHLATLSWLVTAAVPDLQADTDWRRELASRGEDAAIEGRDPPALGTLLEHSAQQADQLGEKRVAEAQLVRALATWRRLADHDGLVRVLVALRALYRSWDRLHLALDASFELVTEYQRRDDDRGLALALTELGMTMLSANRPDSAMEYLTRADTTWQALIPPATIERAPTLVALGRAQWSLGAWGLARRRFSEALALWVDVDDVAAEGVRRLMSQQDGQPLLEND